uniref:HMG-Y-related protein B-like n=1 Tax=Fragaria vesca subsp. vesca TaxID=101020 RepID=UPI0005CAC4E8|nr:PREDICTED: HMG-Y-related protein B-like [Fragaria vesca subsp. vesca]
MSSIRVTPNNSFSTVRLHTQPPSLTVRSHSGGHPAPLENPPFKFLLSFISFSASHSPPRLKSSFTERALMATTEVFNDPPAPANPAPPALPDYPKMIMEAIEGLNETGGSNKTSIAQQIESTHTTDLPPAHATLLAQHLEKMKQSGELAFVKNNYMKPDPNAPPKRGRGRPPKPKVPGAEGAAAVVSSPPRPRGRPPKAKDPFFPTPIVQSSTSGGGSGRPRGRPPKKAKTAPTSTPAAAPASGAPRGRGRPPKVKPSVAPVGC